ncbi:MAG: alpha/beta hydrolase [Cyanobacteria bacterium J055]|nr:MAG: alpha/beta hydrolase [Cyanobacteria bacterium J055]
MGTASTKSERIMSVQLPQILRSLTQGALTSKLFGRSLLLGIGASVFGFGSSASAIETIILRYNTEEVTVTLEELESFAGGAEIETIRQLLEGRVQETQDIASDIVQLLRDALVEDIRISPRMQENITNFLDSSTGEFLLTQLDRVINSTSASTQDSLADLQSSVEASIEDDGFISVLELVRRYPQDTVRVDASGLTGTVNDVAAFVEEIEPVLQTLRDVLQDLICDCPSGDTSSLPPDAQAAQCNESHNVAQGADPTETADNLAIVSEETLPEMAADTEVTR